MHLSFSWDHEVGSTIASTRNGLRARNHTCFWTIGDGQLVLVAPS